MTTVMQSFKKNPVLMMAGVLVGVQVLIAALATWVAPYDPLAQSIMSRLQGISAAHWLGTDKFGRDVLSRVIFGYRLSLGIAISAVLSALVVGGTIGIWAGYLGGWVDRIAMRLSDVLFAFPVLLLSIGVIAVLGPAANSTAIAIAIVYAPIFARLLRGPTLVLARSDFVNAARSIGAGHWHIVVRHLLPNLWSVILVQTSLLLSTAILVEASLSFLGIGAQPPTPSLGRMLAEGRDYISLAPWTSIFSGAAILLVSLAFNLLGDGLRDQLDPRLRGSS